MKEVTKTITVFEAEDGTCFDENGNGFGHDFSLKGCKHWIDEEIKRNGKVC